MSKFSIALALALSLTACGKKKQSAGAAEAIAKLNDYKTKFCACKDDACAAPLLADYMKWTSDFSESKKGNDDMSADDAKAIEKANADIKTCMEAAEKASPGSAAAPPAAPPAEGSGSAAAAPAPAAGGDVPAEVALNFHLIEKNVKTGFITNAEFPKGKGASLPAADCCKTGGKCGPEKDAFAKDTGWAAVDFAVTEPNQFHYTFESDGKTFHAEATGDTDCDGKSQTYKLDIKAENGNPVTAITGP